MKTIIHKAYWNYEKEEKWLNEMSAKGFALSDYSWCRYVFNDCQPGEFIYRIELLEHSSTHPESLKYLRFMEESGVEHIASYMRWVYFRKKSSDGPFDIYSDIDSKIRHFKRVNLLWFTVACAEIILSVPNLSIGIRLFLRNYECNANFFAGCACLFLGLMFLMLGHPIRKRISALKKEKMILE